MKKPITLFLCYIIFLVSCDDNSSASVQITEVEIEENYTGAPMTFAVIGDYGYEGPDAYGVSQLVKSWNPEFIITLGDNNYPDGEFETLKENITQYYEDYIYNPDAPDSLVCNGIANSLAENMFYPSTGNHDYDNPLGILPYTTYFSLPGNEKYYDFIKGPVHFFVLDTYPIEKGLEEEETQMSWLKEKLSNSSSTYKVVYCHHAPYSSSQHGNKEYIQWPFEQWGVDVVLAAHNHVYEKIEPRETANFFYILNGVGGSPHLHPCNKNPLDSDAFISTCYNENHGAIKAIANRDSMVLEFISSDDAAITIDQTVVYKK